MCLKLLDIKSFYTPLASNSSTLTIDFMIDKIFL